MVFEEYAAFTRRVVDLLGDDDLAKVQGILLARPDAGKVIPKSGGLRKLRLPPKATASVAERGLSIIGWLPATASCCWTFTRRTKKMICPPPN